ncbi:SUMF1/EgtB/PvdO family nonheme iron enzyme, partial [Zoogloea sp.]|uniref:SUMF1/EgtB/PvdO family nonheme iron enzyme n=1 Tax=Zoogloea sp. TaxID=49181 RepID=UPI0035AE3BF9
MTPDLTWPPEPQRWPPVFPPECACAWGDDRFGLWIDVVLGGPVQRFRWIEPGEFLMGSPEGEEGRDDNEGPQHLVRLMEGYWLAETACSQAVWQAVMGRNSSDFKDDPQNPVERVSWGEVQGFLREVDLRLPGVKAALPTEAEWEYACRAGSETVFSWGDGITAEQANYDATYSYTNGPTGKWREKTVAVRSFAPNAWGLYQMHGNVWEWCAGGWRDYDGEAQIDPRGPEGVICVLRGGSWINHGRFCRAAYRFRNDEPGHYFNWLGFRLALRSKGPEGLPEAVVAPEGPQGARDAANTEWQRDLSVSHGNIGDVLQAQGDGPGALAAYRNSHAIAEALAARDPANTEWQRDLSVSHNKIGDVLGAQGDGPGALAAYRNSLAIFEALAARDPANTEWQRDLSVSHDRI